MRSATGHSAIPPALVGVVGFVVYVRTLLPGMAFGDWGEMQTVPHVLGVAHPTGYPTYVILGWVAQLLPVGSVAFRANLLSAALVSIALATTVAVLVRLGVRPLVAMAAGLALGAVGTVWSAATVAEVNPLHLAFVALLLFVALRWQAERATRDLILGAVLAGLALGNHLLTLFVAPWIVVFVLWTGRHELARQPWRPVAAALAMIAGASVYLYIPIAASRNPVLPYNHPTNVDSLWWLISGEQFRYQFGFLSPDGPTTFLEALPGLWSVLANRGTPVLPLLGFVGLAVLVRRRRAIGVTCVGIFVTCLYIWANYQRLEHYLLVPWLVLAVGAAVAVDGLIAVGARMPIRSRSSSEAAGVGALTLAIALGALNWSAADRSTDRSAETYVDAVLGALPQDAAILTQWDVSTPLWHAQHVVGRRPDILIVDDTNIVYDGWGTRERRVTALICERPVFVLRLDDQSLAPMRQDFRLVPFLSVSIGKGGPSAVIERRVYRVESLQSRTCPTSESISRRARSIA